LGRVRCMRRWPTVHQRGHRRAAPSAQNGAPSTGDGLEVAERVALAFELRMHSDAVRCGWCEWSRGRRASGEHLPRHQRSSEAIRGHQRSSEAIRGHQRSSVAIRGHQRPSEAIRGHQRPSEAIRGHQRPSEAPGSCDGAPNPRRRRRWLHGRPRGSRPSRAAGTRRLGRPGSRASS
jgi:hypothetical protein